MTELCESFGISRRTGYKYLDQYFKEGLDGLKDKSRAPHHSPQQTAVDVERLLVRAKQAHMRWGPRKLLAWLEPRYPDVNWPAASTVGGILKRPQFSSTTQA